MSALHGHMEAGQASCAEGVVQMSAPVTTSHTLEPFTMVLMQEDVAINSPFVMLMSKANGKVDSQYVINIDDLLKIADEIRRRLITHG